MLKILLFALLWRILGNPFLALLVLLVVLYILDRRFVGLTPSLVKPFRRQSRMTALRRQLAVNNNDVSAKHELARLWMERKKYGEARRLLEPMKDSHATQDSAEFWDDYGTCLLYTGSAAEGEAAIRRALAINSNVKYGQPHLRLAAWYSDKDKGNDPAKALLELEAFRSIQSSSCEGYYRLALIKARLGQRTEAKEALDEALGIYRVLPRYKKKEERKWAFRSLMRKWFA
ncbi:tetratricopeptide repeat protein [Paenibacillus beijingensis]|uniref:Tetratricopeptide repeat protein n=1 Tax=Paenibacillus beijingensis TaxID=1126833 RepID=A0A0D5NEK3_9BACL|nr:hypothetical protein [Paenibacillus beijingensis]AJY73595.1 hypothetical protein VN24_01820 [Paenibacillus beijingensis]